MNLFETRPRTVKALQWFPDNPLFSYIPLGQDVYRVIFKQTPNQDYRIKAGDWLIEGDFGLRFEPMADREFQLTYKLANVKEAEEIIEKVAELTATARIEESKA